MSETNTSKLWEEVDRLNATMKDQQTALNQLCDDKKVAVAELKAEVLKLATHIDTINEYYAAHSTAEPFNPDTLPEEGKTE